MFNREVPHKTSADVLAANSQIASYFNAVDNAVSIGDTNKRYQPVNNTSYGPPPPIHTNTFTTVIISPTADNTADIYNGYINAEMKLNIQLNKSIAAWVTEDSLGDGLGSVKRDLSSPHQVWVGFKNAMDAIEKYEIMANGISIYTQNNAIEESYITACAFPEAARRGNCFSHVRHKDIFDMRLPNSCGAYIDFAEKTPTGSDVHEITIPLKIDLRRFLPISNIKYLPAFAGKIELRILFGIAGLVVAPVNPAAVFNKPHAISQYDIDAITNEFRPYMESFTMITEYTAPTYNGSGSTSLQPIKTYGKLKATSVNINARMNQVSRCESVINCFGIASDVYDALVARYVETPLTFPTQTISFAPLANTLKGKDSVVSSITLTPRFVDSLFLLFPLKQCYRTCYHNPQLTNYLLQCGGYGSIPGIRHGTVDADAAMVMEELQNALNVNCDTLCLNKDVARSMIYEGDDTRGYKSRDVSNFLIGFATETDNTFQQGQTSNTPITYSFVVNQDKTKTYAANVEVPPILGVLVDSTFSIQIRPDGAPAIVEIGAYDITSPMMIQ